MNDLARIALDRVDDLYESNNNVAHEKRKFYGDLEEHIMERLWNRALDEGYDHVLEYEDDGPIYIMVLSDTDRALYNIEPDRHSIMLTEDVYGFVYVHLLTEEEHEEIILYGKEEGGLR